MCDMTGLSRTRFLTSRQRNDHTVQCTLFFYFCSKIGNLLLVQTRSLNLWNPKYYITVLI